MFEKVYRNKHVKKAYQISLGFGGFFDATVAGGSFLDYATGFLPLSDFGKQVELVTGILAAASAAYFIRKYHRRVKLDSLNKMGYSSHPPLAGI